MKRIFSETDFALAIHIHCCTVLSTFMSMAVLNPF
jgi:hypothetical protein